MVAALHQAGFDVVDSDITQGVDFLGQAPETGVLQPDQLTELDNRIALTDVLARLQDYPAKRIDAFLPWNWQRCRVQKTFCPARIPKRIVASFSRAKLMAFRSSRNAVVGMQTYQLDGHEQTAFLP